MIVVILFGGAIPGRTVPPKVLIDGTREGAVRYIGTNIRGKTFTIRPEKGKTIGEFAGWLNNDTSVWAAGEGSSATVLNQKGKSISEIVAREPITPSGHHVRVRFFDRHPIRKIVELPDRKDASSGKLYGGYQIHFKNGKTVKFHSSGNLFIEKKKNVPVIYGVFNVNEYVGRVIDREVRTKPEEAAKAFAIVIRTYLYQNAERQNDSLSIKDSSRYQRVSVREPSPDAMRIASLTDALIIKGIKPIMYNQRKPTPNAISWGKAVALAKKGYSFDEIIKRVFPAGKIDAIEHQKTPQY